MATSQLIQNSLTSQLISHGSLAVLSSSLTLRASNIALLFVADLARSSLTVRIVGSHPSLASVRRIRHAQIVMASASVMTAYGLTGTGASAVCRIGVV